jgi:3-methyladenine DNA glycosylase AlkC
MFQETFFCVGQKFWHTCYRAVKKHMRRFLAMFFLIFLIPAEPKGDVASALLSERSLQKNFEVGRSSASGSTRITTLS